MKTLTHTKTLLVILGLTLAGTSLASCSHELSPKETKVTSPAPQLIKTFVSVKSEK